MPPGDLGGVWPWGTLIWDFWPPGLRDKEFLLSNPPPPAPWHLLPAALLLSQGRDTRGLVGCSLLGDKGGRATGCHTACTLGPFEFFTRCRLY